MNGPRYAVGSNQYRKRFQPFVPHSGAEANILAPPADPPIAYRAMRREWEAPPNPSLVSSRAALCRALDALALQRDALTLIGAHAVHERTKHLDLQSTATKDGDAALLPSLVAAEPRIIASMRSAGFRPLADIAAELPDGHPGKSRWSGRPGLWGTGISDQGQPLGEVDLMVPETVAGTGRRSVGVLRDHGELATGRVRGIELAVLERELMPLIDFESGATRMTWIARPSGLICAKAYKITDRLVAGTRNPGRLASVPKDAADLWRCMLVSQPEEVADAFSAHTDLEPMGQAVAEGRARFERILVDPSVSQMISESMAADGVADDEVAASFDLWRSTFG